MGTFTIIDSCDIPPGSKEIDCCFSSKIKKDSEGNILEYRMRYNADGRHQAPGSYGDTFAPTSKLSCIRTICAITAQEGLTLYQFDVKGAVLMAKCKEDVFIRLPGKYRISKGSDSEVQATTICTEVWMPLEGIDRRHTLAGIM